MNLLVEQFQRYGWLSTKAQHNIASCTKQIVKKKHDYFLKAGQKVSSYFVIKRGLIRAFFYRNGKEVNTWFGEENQIFCSILPVYTDRPALEYIQFLEDSEIYAISASDLNALYLQYPELNLIGRKIAEEVCVVLEERTISLHTQSALERYGLLIEQQPNVLKRVSLGHIASYLGITQETLSRIRRF